MTTALARKRPGAFLDDSVAKSLKIECSTSSDQSSSVIILSDSEAEDDVQILEDKTPNPAESSSQNGHVQQTFVKKFTPWNRRVQPAQSEPALNALGAARHVSWTTAARPDMRQMRSNFAALSRDIQNYHSRVSQSDYMRQLKLNLRHELMQLVQMIHPNADMFVVGSTITNLGSSSSDMDLCLALFSTMDGYNKTRPFAVETLKSVRSLFRMRGRYIIKDVQLIPAKVPILKMSFHPPFHSITVDLNINNVAGVYNSHLLHYYAACDARFQEMCLVVKGWAAEEGINDPCRGTLNSYSLVLLVLHYLQCEVQPPVLPNLQALMPEVFAPTRPPEQLTVFMDLPDAITSKCRANKQSVGQLLRGFFAYYARGGVDFDTQAISIRNACLFERTDEDKKRFCMYIEEPYDGLNTARCVYKAKQFEDIVSAFVRADCSLGMHESPSLTCLGYGFENDNSHAFSPPDANAILRRV